MTSTGGFARRADAARQMVDLIRSDILAGELRGTLPLEFALVSRYGGTRNAIRDALGQLRDQGLVTRLPRSGTAVAADTVTFSLERADVPIQIDERHAGEAEDHRLITLQRRPAPEVVARHLDVEVSAEVAYVETAHAVRGIPLRLRASWVPVARCPDLFDGRDLAGYLPDLVAEAVGRPVHTQRMLMEALASDERTAELLEVPRGTALFILERLMALPDGTPVEFGFSRIRGDRTVFDSRLRTGSRA